MSAWVDLTQAGQSFETNAASDPSISKAYLDRMSALYLGDTDATTPYASPLHAELSGLPPLLLQVGSTETLLDDSIEFARKAENSGVQVSCEVWPQMFHGWQGSAHLLDDAQLAIDSIGTFCTQKLGG